MSSFAQKSCVPSQLLKIELEQSRDEGKEVNSFIKDVEEVIHLSDDYWFERESRAAELFTNLQTLPSEKNYPFYEPNVLPEITREITNDNFQFTQEKISFQQVYGAILGKCIGCLLGKPVEGWSRMDILQWMQKSNNLPLKKYLFDHTNDISLVDWVLPLTGMPEDDDINYLLIANKVITTFGLDFTAGDVASTWLNYLPVFSLCTAERIAYRNLVNGIYPPQSAIYCNPYREWIGAQIRADYLGLIAFGNPFLAMKLAWQDAQVSHTKNGIYGAIWVAALIASIPHTNTFLDNIQFALNFIPKTSRFFKAILQVIGWYQSHLSVNDAILRLHQLYSEKNIHHWCHVLPNAMIVTIALLWGSDFIDALQIVMISGFDTDSNGATVGSIMGCRIGAENIPDYWKHMLNNQIYSSVAGQSVTTIDQLARETILLPHVTRHACSL